MDNLEQYLKEINFDKQFIKLLQKLKDKKVIIYGAGSFFELINSKYNLTKLNIIGISDTWFNASEEGEKFLGYSIIPKSKIAEYNPDVILVSTRYYMDIIYDLKSYLASNTYIRPLAEISLVRALKEIWKFK